MLRVLAYRLICLFYKPTVDGLVANFEFTADRLRDLADAEAARASVVEAKIRNLVSAS